MDCVLKLAFWFTVTCACVSTSTSAHKATEVPTVETKNVTAHYCPYPCTVGNETLCYPPPCPPPFCADPAKLQPTDCCEYCPNGPDCRAPDGSIVKYNQWKIVNGKNCTCKNIGQGTDCA